MSIAGIYGRKSLFTAKGESIRNQIDACKEYAQKKNWEVIEYYDEGYSGKNIERPGFQKLIADIEAKKIDHVIFYKLDRISRRMLDILEFIEKTSKQNIDFISITENFDTTTPLGRAMVHIAATFAQLEREMLQQRVKDNMLRLARTGRWLGGVTPTGYEAKQINFSDINGKTKTKFVLEGIPTELAIVEMIFHKYLHFKSLARLEKYLLENNIKTKNNNYFKKQTLKIILSNPVYIKADMKAYKHFESLNIDIASAYEEFDGIKGVLVYNKNIIRKGQSHEIRDYDQWILAVSSHHGIIEAKDWIEVQKLMNKNYHKHPRQNRSNISLLTGILRCKCGAYMKIKHGRFSASSDKRTFYYLCANKNNPDYKCTTKNIRGDLLDSMILSALKTIFPSMEYILKALKESENSFFNIKAINNLTLQVLIDNITEKENSIQHLLSQLESNASPLVAQRIMQRIEGLDDEINQCRKEIDQLLPQENHLNFSNLCLDMIKTKLSSADTLLQSSSKHIYRFNPIADLIEKAVYMDGKIELFFL